MRFLIVFAVCMIIAMSISKSEGKFFLIEKFQNFLKTKLTWLIKLFVVFRSTKQSRPKMLRFEQATSD